MASTKRNPAPVAGRVTVPVTSIAALTLAHPVFPLSAERALTYKLEAPREYYITGAWGVKDVLEGDILTDDGIDYIVRTVKTWTTPVAYTKIIMERP